VVTKVKEDMILSREKLKEIFGVDYYDGSMIHNRFAYKVFRDKVIPIGNIMVFRSPTIVEKEFMIDLEDVISGDYIYSDDMINICYELPMTNLYGGVCFQRLFCTLIGDILGQTIDAEVVLEGDDIFVHKEHKQGGIIQPSGKASVSIVGEKNGAILGHTGINITAGKKAPAFAYSTNMTDDEAELFMKTVIQAFYMTSQDIFQATTKIIL